MLKSLKEFLEKHSRATLVVFWVVNVGNILVSLIVSAYMILVHHPFIILCYLASLFLPIFPISLFFEEMMNILKGNEGSWYELPSSIAGLSVPLLFFGTLVFLIIFYFLKLRLFSNPGSIWKKRTKKLAIFSTLVLFLPLILTLWADLSTGAKSLLFIFDIVRHFFGF